MSSMPPERLTKWTFAMTGVTATICFAIMAGLWTFHLDSRASAAQIANHGARITSQGDRIAKLEDAFAKVGPMADDLSVIRRLLEKAERAQLRGSRESLPGAEGETINGLPRGAGG